MTEKAQSGGDGAISVRYLDGIAILTMERGENRMNQKFVDKFHAALDDIERRTEVKALITTGVGKFYSNGLDLNWLLSLTPKQFAFHLETFKKLFLRFLTFPVITIAAINGHCFAGGAILSLVHDYRVMSNDKGWWSLNEIFLGMRFSPWMLKLIHMQVNQTARTDVVLRGKRLTAEDAKVSGIIHMTSSPETLITCAKTFAAVALPPNPSIDRKSLQNMKTDLFQELFEIIKKEMSNL